MPPERWAAVESIYHAALERAPAERSRWLQLACGDDASLREEVESLLACANATLSNPAARPEMAKLWEHIAGNPDAPLTPALPPTIGRYRILRLLGEGGMGIVYEAEQEQPRRTVALKVIKSGLGDPKLVRRFEQEALALGQLQHPGIAQIYEAGTADNGSGSQPYFAMELIRGRPLVEYANAEGLNSRQRLELTARICEAVHHAHQRGIIHRDLKPGNILVDETGQPKILDFGVARATDSDAHLIHQTDLGQLVGTLAYMSPEQVLADPMDLDTRTDVYALGVMLYELLAAQTLSHQPKIARGDPNDSGRRRGAAQLDRPRISRRRGNHCGQGVRERQGAALLVGCGIGRRYSPLSPGRADYRSAGDHHISATEVRAAA